ncbi:MAG: GTPase domain-containing protein [Candidatus Thermoplasmatota archaeon]|jgi:GTPase SAR1 family protein|nr:GTPase domain-containing protein [Candidatus Thermoplasmatota archaeon]MCL5791035.1 GTPase domain-containing protein [Candidatus Thermoplasmatota archaeon]
MISSRFIWKVSVVGTSGSGKSSLISRIVYDSDNGNFGNKGLLRKKISVNYDGKQVESEFIIQEIDGFVENEKIMSGSSVIIIVADVTKELNEKEIHKFIKFVSILDRKPLMVISATKIDRKYEAVTWQEDLEPLSKEYNVPVYMVSSRIPDTVKKMTDDIVIRLLERKNGKF